MQKIKMFENLVSIKNNTNWVSSPAGAAVYLNSDGRQSKQWAGAGGYKLLYHCKCVNRRSFAILSNFLIKKKKQKWNINK